MSRGITIHKKRQDANQRMFEDLQSGLDYRITGGRPSLFHLTWLCAHSTAACTPDLSSALTGSTRLSRTPVPVSPSKTFRTNPSLIRTTSTQYSRSCLLANTKIGTPATSALWRTDSSTCRHSSRRPNSAPPALIPAFCYENKSPALVLPRDVPDNELGRRPPAVGSRVISGPWPTSALSTTKIIA